MTDKEGVRDRRIAAPQRAYGAIVHQLRVQQVVRLDDSEAGKEQRQVEEQCGGGPCPSWVDAGLDAQLHLSTAENQTRDLCMI